MIANAADRDTDPGALAALRVAAMRPSLEAIGRFDPQRARDRFLSTYDPRDTQTLYSGGNLAGFFVVRRRPDHLYLDQIQIHPDHQGNGLGQVIIRTVQGDAEQAGLPVKLMALRGSRANDFYVSCGFVQTGSDDTDNTYVWVPDTDG